MTDCVLAKMRSVANLDETRVLWAETLSVIPAIKIKKKNIYILIINFFIKGLFLICFPFGVIASSVWVEVRINDS